MIAAIIIGSIVALVVLAYLLDAAIDASDDRTIYPEPRE